MTSVKEVDGTEDFMDFAKEKNLCQNEKSFQDCLTETFMHDSLMMCKCVPFGVKLYDSQVFLCAPLERLRRGSL